MSNKELRRFAQRHLEQSPEVKIELDENPGKVKRGQKLWDSEINSGDSFGCRVKNERV